MFRRGPGRLASTLTDLPSLIDILHNVNKIKLIGKRWKSFSRKFIDSLASRSFISITVIRVHFTNSNAFYSFLSHSHNLREFSCLMTVIDSPPFSASFDISYRPHITELCLHKTNQIAEMILSPSLSPMSLDRLRVLDVLLEQDHDFDLARRFMNLTVTQPSTSHYLANHHQVLRTRVLPKHSPLTISLQIGPSICPLNALSLSLSR